MKKALLGLLLFTSFATFAQEDEQNNVKHHEIKVNAFNLIIFKSVDFSYEYLIDSESSIGVSALINLQNQEDRYDADSPVYREKFALTPYYRRFFSSRHAWGFFLEAFGMYSVQEDNHENYDAFTDQYIYSDETSNSLGFGMTVGGKFVSKKGFLFEIYGGVGRNISTSNNNVGTEFIPRLGASLGWRF